jgi:type 1 fimbria pilin
MVSTPYPTISGSSLVGRTEVIIKTNVPGVGIVMDTMIAPTWDTTWTYVPHAGINGTGVPYTGYFKKGTLSSSYEHIAIGYRIIKIGDIDPGLGPQSLDGMVAIQYATTGSGDVAEAKILNGTINVSQCSLPPAPGNQIDVPMGTWNLSTFSAGRSTSVPQGFVIPLNNCVTGGSDSAFAYIRLEGKNGSTIVNAEEGILGLNSDSTAKGVAVQVLKADAITPLPLGVDVPVQRLINGAVSISLAAQYILADESLTAGTANASAGFTLTYK